MDVYIALLRSATSRSQSDAEFAANSAKVAASDPRDDSYLTKMLRAYVLPHRDWLNTTSAATRCGCCGTSSSRTGT